MKLFRTAFELIVAGERPEDPEQVGDATFTGSRDRLAAIGRRSTASNSPLTHLLDAVRADWGRR